MAEYCEKCLIEIDGLSPEHLEFLANIVRFYREEDIESDLGSKELMKENFPEKEYKDIPGLCKTATIEEIEEQNYSLNPGRYIGIKEKENGRIT
ncbi:MAG: N-6 DNA methylase [bacterium]